MTRLLPLDAEHRQLGAHLVESEGWSVPQYFAGVFKEYQAMRSSSVVWDASNLEAIRVRGLGSFDRIQGLFSNDLRRVRVGRSQYSLLLDFDGSVLDEVVIWHISDQEFVIFANEAATVTAALSERGSRQVECDFDRLHSGLVLLALQGQNARQVLMKCVAEVGGIGRGEVRPFVRIGRECRAATTGFGGVDGFEFWMPIDAGRHVYQELLRAGAQPTGVGLREIRRLESGLPLLGRELVRNVTPWQADLGSAVCLDKSFRGREALLDEKNRGLARILRRVVVEGRSIPRRGDEVTLDRERIGEVTSDGFSLGAHKGIGLAFVNPKVPEGTSVSVQIRGKSVRAVLRPRQTSPGVPSALHDQVVSL